MSLGTLTLFERSLKDWRTMSSSELKTGAGQEREHIESEVKERNKNVKLIRLSKRYLIDLILVLSTRLSRGDLQL